MIKGSKHTALTIKKMSISHKGNTGRIGRKHSDEVKEKIRKIILSNKLGFQKDYIPWNKGVKTGIKPTLGMKFTKETKQKMSLNNSRYWLNKKRSKEDILKFKLSHLGKMIGDKNPSWKGGITPIYSIIRHSFYYKEFTQLIRRRDYFTCQICKQKGGKLQVDHYPTSFAQIIHQFNIKSLEQALSCPKMWDKNNLRTLCLDCHKLTDTYLKPLSKHLNLEAL